MDCERCIVTDHYDCDDCQLGPCKHDDAACCEVRNLYKDLQARSSLLENRDAGDGQVRPGSESREDPQGVRPPEGASGGRALPHAEHAVTRIIVGDCAPLAEELPYLDLSGAEQIAIDVARWLGDEHARVMSECRGQLFAALGGTRHFALSQSAKRRVAEAYLSAFEARDFNATNRRKTQRFARYWMSDFVTFKGEKES